MLYYVSILGSALVSLTQVCLLYYVSILGQYWSQADLSVELRKSFGVSIGLIDADLSVVLCEYFGVSIGLQLVCLLYYVSIILG